MKKFKALLLAACLAVPFAGSLYAGEVVNCEQAKKESNSITLFDDIVLPEISNAVYTNMIPFNSEDASQIKRIKYIFKDAPATVLYTVKPVKGSLDDVIAQYMESYKSNFNVSPEPIDFTDGVKDCKGFTFTKDSKTYHYYIFVKDDNAHIFTLEESGVSSVDLQDFLAGIKFI